MEPRELLEIACRTRTLVADPERWTPRHYAEDGTGRWIPVGSNDAVRFSLEGAVVRTAGGAGRNAVQAIRSEFALASPRLHARLAYSAQPLTRLEALELLDATIARLRLAPGASQSGVRASVPDQDLPSTDRADGRWRR